MAEHGGRYGRFAAALAAAGIAVHAGDHRGHGRTAARAEDLGFFAERDGWRRVLDDLWQINRNLAVQHPGLPIFFFGHSMGSFLGQQFMAEHGAALAGVILCGSNGPPGPLVTLGRLVAQIERFRLGPRGRSALLNQLSFGEFNRAFRPARTEFDWLSRDPAEVDAYIADPLCGFVCCTELWCELLANLPRIAAPEMLARLPRDLPLLVIAGTADPVSAGTRGLTRLLAAWQAAGLTHFAHIFYKDARHELLNETNRDEVTGDILRWLLDRLASRG
ncbi:MAG: alpha/beta hydrolase [Alphaproteobacteria bacterium]|nr:alpha/beta hydrolase [Alphaproteobacteria bacterium]